MRVGTDAIWFLHFPCTSGDEPYGVAFSVDGDLDPDADPMSFDFDLDAASTSFTFFTFTEDGFVKELQFGWSVDVNGNLDLPTKEYGVEYDGADDLVGLTDLTMPSSRAQIVEVRFMPHFFHFDTASVHVARCTGERG